MQTVKGLYQTYERSVFRYLYGLTLDYHTAEELTQETFFQVVKSLPRFRGDSHVTTWLYKIARNVYSEWQRKQLAPIITLDVETISILRDDPQELSEAKERSTQIEEVLRELPEKYREVLWLREWQEMTYEEIALLTNHTVSWVKVNLLRARRLFRDAYQKREAFK